MKIIIRYHEGEWPIDTESTPQENLDSMLDTFTQSEVRTIINEGLAAFGGIRDAWNQRELTDRRKSGLNA
jgi:hypothetical protein